MSYVADYWNSKGQKTIEDAMEAEGISREVIERIISVINDVTDEISWEARENGRFEESFYHECNPD